MNEFTIIVADDDPIIVELLEAQLSIENYNILLAYNGSEVLDLLKDNKVDLILLDIMMPIMDGITTLKNVRENYNITELPIILLSAKSLDEDVSKGLALGANDYIIKPFTYNILLNRVKNQLTIKKLTDEINKKNNSLHSLTEKLESMLNQTMNLMAFSNEINTINFDELIEKSKTILPKLFNAKVFTLFILNKNKNYLELIGHNHSEWSGDKTVIIPESNCLMWDCVRKKKTIKIKEFSKSKYAKNKTQNKKYADDAVITSPMIVNNKVIGIINLNNMPTSSLTNENIANINRIINHLALAINNALLHNKIENISIKDELTNLYNRRYLYKKLKSEILRANRYGTPLSAIMFDIDHFKKVNDNYGHSNGDIVLEKTSTVITSILRETDIACRYGGEEFYILLPNTTLEEAQNLAERIRVIIENNVILLNDKSQFSITISLGVSEFKINNENEDELLNRTDAALYEAKENGRNRCVISS